MKYTPTTHEIGVEMIDAAIYRELRDELYNRAKEMTDTDENCNSEIRDNAELLKVLARMIEGKSVYEAFGAPGAWGYGTPIGEALRTCYSKPRPNPSGAI